MVRNFVHVYLEVSHIYILAVTGTLTWALFETLKQELSDYV